MKILLQNLTKKFPGRGKKSPEEVIAVNDFTFEIPDGKLIGLLGPSGCGKSTALNLICGLQKPTAGKIFFGEDDVTDLPPEHRGVGLVFQNYALYPHLTVLKNITFPLENLRGADRLTKEEMEKRALEAAGLVQLEGLMDRKPSELSGGQQQRVAIGRALITRPAILLADEPTGNLDSRASDEIMTLLAEANRKYKQTIIMITHNPELAKQADRVLTIEDGRIREGMSFRAGEMQAGGGER